jgi:cytochrome oxidase Cu insertion factor (SCO1/SenC/PrrC family)
MLFFAFGLLGFFIPLGFADVVDDLMSAARVMKFKAELMALDFTINDVEGKRVGLDDFRGKVVLLAFWATW